MQFLRLWFQRHPLVRQSCLWALPAIAFGAALRVLLCSYLPLAYWGSDSASYYGFAYRLLEEGEISLYDKRRYLYPLLLLPIELLPGATLRWVAWLQHGFGLLTLVPLAYCIRKTMLAWQWWIVPVTLFYAGLPIVLWYEHELLAETLFFAGAIWAMAGWCAWTGEARPERARRLWWIFFAGLALIVLIKPAGRFFWPGIGVALAVVSAWRVLRWRQWAALAAMCGLSLTIGQDSQGAWLLYTSSFPLTRLETPLHAEYKAEIAGLVRRARLRLDKPDAEDAAETKEWKFFLKNPERYDGYPLWQRLGDDHRKKAALYRDLALEGITARPDLFARISLLKILSSANSAEFKADRFQPGYFVEKFEHLYVRDAAREPARMRRLLGLRAGEPMPDYATIAQRIARDPESPRARWLEAYAMKFQARAAFIDAREDDVDRAAPTALGRWLLVAMALAFLPIYLRGPGLWTLILAGYLFGVFLVGGANPRFFGPAWPVVAVLLPLPADAAVRMWSWLRQRFALKAAAGCPRATSS